MVPATGLLADVAQCALLIKKLDDCLQRCEDGLEGIEQDHQHASLTYTIKQVEFCRRFLDELDDRFISLLLRACPGMETVARQFIQ